MKHLAHATIALPRHHAHNGHTPNPMFVLFVSPSLPL